MSTISREVRWKEKTRPVYEMTTEVAIQNIHKPSKKFLDHGVKPLTDGNDQVVSDLAVSPVVAQPIQSTNYFKAKVVSLIYWEIPARSATVLVSLLGGLVLTQYYSLLYLGAAAFTIVTGINWIYVNLHQQGQRPTVLKKRQQQQQQQQQQSARLRHATVFSRDRMDRIARIAIDVAEVTMNQLLKLVLVENSWYSGCAVLISYCTWTLAKHLAVKHLAGLMILAAFTIPRMYWLHHQVIDYHVARESQRVSQVSSYAIQKIHKGVSIIQNSFM
ncbi:hypothetical protein DFQ30_011062 [Apophysomyces sp. BC1015]|nr:hypothetical protein DFQ30_011062 [Apophysomyces sp. BC1015]